MKVKNLSLWRWHSITGVIPFTALMIGGCCLTENSMHNKVTDPVPFAKVIMKIYVDKWTTVEEVVFFPDGKFHRVIYDPETKSVVREQDGRMTDDYLKVMRDKVLNSGEFKEVGCIATYEFGIDDHLTPDPSDIRGLVNRIVENR